MKVFVDTNVYVAEALLGKAAARIIRATHRARWRIYTSPYLLEELLRVLTNDLEFSVRLAGIAERRVLRRSSVVEGRSKARVPQDPKDSPILQAALACGADYLVSNDRHLLAMDPHESLRIISMDQYHDLLKQHGLLK
jgi:putative PIN family toxin of toxin-antitoxin system